jgi:hypothetical protein
MSQCSKVAKGEKPWQETIAMKFKREIVAIFPEFRDIPAYSEAPMN